MDVSRQFANNNQELGWSSYYRGLAACDPEASCRGFGNCRKPEIYQLLSAEKLLGVSFGYREFEVFRLRNISANLPSARVSHAPEMLNPYRSNPKP